ncbi:relaxase/mobilization nuclease domain-containing protein [Sediminibacterium roseum]|uniref:Relaxase/mobilization nuclease domain-containing protein n=1 Tax=Sediminibacterium roseum TaxID=1978412 RepID=A0ABW9ZTH6_9BACT|nr:relaxase/mobilization nuclease domain-containing protein [Sediminibacterium roseum]NCI49785.1 relaxase/mobilization nuclease domain-containing protein [Sediminibacterium roseum]
MIGKFLTGKSFRGCLLYCLNDKQQKPNHELVKKDRAEVILFNQCFGNQKELINQFNEVRQLNSKLAKPVLHITLSPSTGDKLVKEEWQKLATDCAAEFGFDKNQFVAVLHNDTAHHHLHLIANRIGFDRKTVSDSNSYKKMAAYCRKMELKYDLEQVLSPKQFLSKELRNIPRIDERKSAIKSHIREAILASKNYSEFELYMKQNKYEVIKGRGIAFIDPKKVYVKGSEVGYSLSVIEKILSQSLAEKQRLFDMQKVQEKSQRLSYSPNMKDKSKSQIHEVKQDFSKAIEILLRAEEMRQQTPHELLPKKRKKKRQSLHL